MVVQVAVVGVGVEVGVVVDVMGKKNSKKMEAGVRDESMHANGPCARI